MPLHKHRPGYYRPSKVHTKLIIASPMIRGPVTGLLPLGLEHTPVHHA